MFRGRRIILSILVILLALGLLAAVGFGSYRMGYVQGYTQNAGWADNDEAQSPWGLRPPGITMWPGMAMRSHMGFFPFAGLCGFGLLGLLLIFGLMAMFRPRHWWHHGYPPPWGPPPGGMPPAGGCQPPQPPAPPETPAQPEAHS